MIFFISMLIAIVFFPTANEDLIEWTGTNDITEITLLKEPIYFIELTRSWSTDIKSYFIFYSLSFYLITIGTYCLFLSALTYRLLRLTGSKLNISLSLLPVLAFFLSVLINIFISLFTKFIDINIQLFYGVWILILLKWILLGIVLMVVLYTLFKLIMGRSSFFTERGD